MLAVWYLSFCLIRSPSLYHVTLFANGKPSITGEQVKRLFEPITRASSALISPILLVYGTEIKIKASPLFSITFSNFVNKQKTYPDSEDSQKSLPPRYCTSYHGYTA